MRNRDEKRREERSARKGKRAKRRERGQEKKKTRGGGGKKKREGKRRKVRKEATMQVKMEKGEGGWGVMQVGMFPARPGRRNRVGTRKGFEI